MCVRGAPVRISTYMYKRVIAILVPRYYSALCKFAPLALMKHLPLPACIFLAHRERRCGAARRRGAFAHADRRDAARLLARARDGRGHGRFN